MNFGLLEQECHLDSLLTAKTQRAKFCVLIII